MSVGEVATWIVALLLTFVVAGLACAATRPGRERLALPGLVPIALMLGWAALDPSPRFALAGDGTSNAILAPFPVALGAGLAFLGVVAGNPLVSFVLSLSSRGDIKLGTHGGILVRDKYSPAPERAGGEREILRGGTVIGYLERFALIVSVLVGQFAAVALIVAIKGLGRFSELDNERARERFIIGTLASLIWASLCALAIIAVL